VSSSIHTPRSSDQTKKLPKTTESNTIYEQIEQEPSSKTDSDDHTLTQKESLTENNTTSESPFEQKPYYHDILVIHTQPPKVNKSNKSKNSFILFIFFKARTIV
jgi:hypothetical protein